MLHSFVVELSDGSVAELADDEISDLSLDEGDDTGLGGAENGIDLPVGEVRSVLGSSGSLGDVTFTGESTAGEGDQREHQRPHQAVPTQANELDQRAPDPVSPHRRPTQQPAKETSRLPHPTGVL